MVKLIKGILFEFDQKTTVEIIKHCDVCVKNRSFTFKYCQECGSELREAKTDPVRVYTTNRPKFRNNTGMRLESNKVDGGMIFEIESLMEFAFDDDAEEISWEFLDRLVRQNNSRVFTPEEIQEMRELL